MGDWLNYMGTLQDFVDVEVEIEGEYRDQFADAEDFAAYCDQWC